MSTARYAVFGHPIAHSLSPQIHAAFARLRGISLDYTAIDATPDEFAAALERFAASGGRGCNVTLPLKEAAFALCAQVSDRARRAGACNTLTRVDGHWQGDNTDGAGLVHDLTSRHGLDLRARRVLLIGAGGAARGQHGTKHLDVEVGEAVGQGGVGHAQSISFMNGWWQSKHSTECSGAGIIGASFLAGLPSQLATMHAALQAGDRSSLSRQAHTLAGLLGNFQAAPAIAIAVGQQEGVQAALLHAVFPDLGDFLGVGAVGIAGGQEGVNL